MILLLVMSAVTAVAAPGGDAPARSIAGTVHRALMGPDRKVRSVGDRVEAALRDGARRSPTFANLLVTLACSDVIVYIELSHDLPSMTEGRTMLVSKSPLQRYVRIQLRAALSSDEIITVMGHELQHAVEIAAIPSIRDESSLRRFYERAGAGRSRRPGYETEAAQDAGYRVRFELRRNT